MVYDIKKNILNEKEQDGVSEYPLIFASVRLILILAYGSLQYEIGYLLLISKLTRRWNKNSSEIMFDMDKF